MKKLSVDNPFFEFMGRLGDVVMVNLLFLVCCVPVVTIGASVFAMYQTFREMEEKTFVSVFRSFRRAFASSLKKSIPAWMACFLAGAVLVFDLLYIPRLGNGWFWHMAAMVIGSLMLLWLFVICWLFPLGLFKERGIWGSVVRSLFLAVGNLPYTVVMVLLNLVPAVCFLASNYIMALVAPPYLVAGFGVTAFINAKLMKRCGERLTNSEKKI